MMAMELKTKRWEQVYKSSKTITMQGTPAWKTSIDFDSSATCMNIYQARCNFIDSFNTVTKTRLPSLSPQHIAT